MSLNVLYHMYEQTRFDLDAILRATGFIVSYIKRYDPVVYKLIEAIPAAQLGAILLKYQLSNCMHVSESLQVTFSLCKIYLSSTVD